MKVIDRQAVVRIWGATGIRTVYKDGEKLFVKWYGEMVEVERSVMIYVAKK